MLDKQASCAQARGLVVGFGSIAQFRKHVKWATGERKVEKNMKGRQKGRPTKWVSAKVQEHVGIGKRGVQFEVWEKWKKKRRKLGTLIISVGGLRWWPHKGKLPSRGVGILWQRGLAHHQRPDGHSSGCRDWVHSVLNVFGLPCSPVEWLYEHREPSASTLWPAAG
jgi:hypothetical protein